MAFLHQILHFASYAFMAIFPIINPIGMSPIFLGLTRHYPAETRRSMAKRVAAYSFFILWGALVVGSSILGFFGLSIPIVKVAGGIVIYFTAMGMLNSKPKLSNQEQRETSQKEGDITFFPLTMPLTAGAGSMATAMTIGADIIDKGTFDFLAAEEMIGATLGMLLLCSAVFVCYYFSDRIFAKLGKIGTDVVTQLSAFILLAVSIEIIWEGAKVLIWGN